MSEQESTEILSRVSDIAALAGVRGEVEGQHGRFAMCFDVGEGRSQSVYVRHTAKAADGSPVVSFISPCVVLNKGFLSGISKEQALELLHLNEQVLFARFGIHEYEKQSLIVASIDHLLDTLDPEEFRASAWYVAIAADRYESKYGRDDF